MDTEAPLREHILELLAGRSAHIDLDSAVDGFPLDRMNERPAHSPHSAWELLEHIRIALWDIVEFSRNADHRSPKWPDEYWPANDGTPAEWHRSVEQVRHDLDSMRSLVSNTDLFAKIPHGSGQTILREALLASDHTAYHLGQLVLLRRMFEKGDG